MFSGYSAIWKISKADCEELEIKFPCEVYGIVQDTDFNGLAAIFTVESVQDENVHLPESCRVALEDLYPTVEQENPALNVDLTADILDRYRFFFSYIFMPWDDSDTDFVDKQLFPRMKLIFDLKNKQLSKGLSSHIRGMIAEAKYIQNKQENLESTFNESGDEIDISKGETKDKARKLLELHFRLIKIKHEIDILVNPDMREIYEELKFPLHQLSKCPERQVFVVTKTGTLSEQMQLVHELKGVVNDEAKIYWVSLHDAIASASASSEIYIPCGSHSINFLEYLNGDILLQGLTPFNIETFEMEQTQRRTRINATDCSSLLFAVDGNLQLKNLVIDCEDVKTGFLIKDGVVTIKNCFIIGSAGSSVTEAFAIGGPTKVIVENCVITNFATAFSVGDHAQFTLRNTIIKNCNYGIHLLTDEAQLTFENSSILNCEDNGILKTSQLLDGVKSKALVVDDKVEAAKFQIHFSGDANKFDGNKKGNIMIASQFSRMIMAEMDSSMEM